MHRQSKQAIMYVIIIIIIITQDLSTHIIIIITQDLSTHIIITQDLSTYREL
jgi:hypothetical protein